MQSPHNIEIHGTASTRPLTQVYLTWARRFRWHSVVEPLLSKEERLGVGPHATGRCNDERVSDVRSVAMTRLQLGLFRRKVCGCPCKQAVTKTAR